MRTRIGAGISVVFTVGALLLAAVGIAQTPTFTVKQLGNFPGGTQAAVKGINSAGEAVGEVNGSVGCPSACAVLWTDDIPALLGSVPGETGSEAIGVNNSGEVAGTVFTASGQQTVIWTNGIPTLLPAPGSQAVSTFPAYLSDSGEVVGGSVATNGAETAVVWNGSTPTTLGLVPGYTSAGASAVNSGALVVGEVCCGSENAHEAVIWHGTVPTLLPKLNANKGTGGEALAVNNNGLVVGHVSVAAGQAQAAAWTNGVVTELGTIGSRSFAMAVNKHGIIVGQSATNTGLHAVLWNKVGAAPQDLNSLISAAASAKIVLTGATGINDSCAIVANGLDLSNGAPEAFVLTLSDPSTCSNGL